MALPGGVHDDEHATSALATTHAFAIVAAIYVVIWRLALGKRGGKRPQAPRSTGRVTLVAVIEEDHVHRVVHVLQDRDAALEAAHLVAVRRVDQDR